MLHPMAQCFCDVFSDTQTTVRVETMYVVCVRAVGETGNLNQGTPTALSEYMPTGSAAATSARLSHRDVASLHGKRNRHVEHMIVGPQWPRRAIPAVCQAVVPGNVQSGKLAIRHSRNREPAARRHCPANQTQDLALQVSLAQQVENRRTGRRETHQIPSVVAFRRTTEV